MQRVHTPIAVAAFAALTASMTVGCRAVPGHAPATAAAEAEVRQVVDVVREVKLGFARQADQ